MCPKYSLFHKNLVYTLQRTQSFINKFFLSLFQPSVELSASCGNWRLVPHWNTWRSQIERHLHLNSSILEERMVFIYFFPICYGITIDFIQRSLWLLHSVLINIKCCLKLQYIWEHFKNAFPNVLYDSNNDYISLLAFETKDVAWIMVMALITIKIVRMNSCDLKIFLSIV